MQLLSKIATAVALTASLGAAQAANLVTNGSFESGLTGWTTGGADAQGYPISVIDYNSNASYPTGAFGEPVPQNNAFTNSPDAVGGHAAYFVSDLATAQSLTQSIELSAGIYQIGFSAYAPGNGYDNRFDATFRGVITGEVLANYAVSAGPMQTWQTFASSGLYLDAGIYEIEFSFSSFGDPAKDVVIDQVYVIAGDPPTEVPEPGTLAVLGLGLLAMGAVRRRQA